MCELTLEAAGMTREEIEALPTRKTWYGIVGQSESSLTPWKITDNAEVAKASAVIANHEYPSSGPWHVVTLTENLSMPVSTRARKPGAWPVSCWRLRMG